MALLAAEGTQRQIFSGFYKSTLTLIVYILMEKSNLLMRREPRERMQLKLKRCS